MKKLIYKDSFDGNVKILKTNDVDTFLKKNAVEKIIAIVKL